eukprot:scaffold463_cov351-Prasinococcus_capsulatus_cf.AAC.4
MYASIARSPVMGLITCSTTCAVVIASRDTSPTTFSARNLRRYAVLTPRTCSGSNPGAWAAAVAMWRRGSGVPR